MIKKTILLVSSFIGFIISWFAMVESFMRLKDRWASWEYDE